MTLARALPPLAKEIRALLPIWLGCLGALAALAAARAGAVISDGSAEALGLLVYGVTAITLGAFSIGHEYTSRTLAQLLCQPESRASILIRKMAVLAVLLVTLAGMAWGTVVFPSGPTVLFVVAVVPFGLFVTPCLTMLCRNPLAGAVFTIAIPGVVWILANVVAVGQARFAAFAAGLQTVSAIAVVMCWVTFRGLEAIEGRGSHVSMPVAGDGAMARTTHPVWLLVKKELGLQQMALAVAALYVVIWLALVATKATVTALDDLRHTDLFAAVAVMYSGMLALLIGALASAEERQLGTADWQALLPMSSLRQWGIKAATAIVLALLLSAGLPALLLSISGAEIGVGPWFLAEILMLTVSALYVSSLCGNGLRALVLSLAPAMAVTYLLGWLPHIGQSRAVPLVLLAVGVALALFFALQNHRSAERGVVRVVVQLFCLAGCLALCLALFTVGSMVHLR
jgi:hypothetical protein